MRGKIKFIYTQVYLHSFFDRPQKQELRNQNEELRNQKEEFQNQVTDLDRRFQSAEHNFKQEKEELRNQNEELRNQKEELKNQLDESQIETLRKELFKRDFDKKDCAYGLGGGALGLFVAKVFEVGSPYGVLAFFCGGFGEV